MALEPKTVTAEPEDDSELRDMTHRFLAATALAIPVLLLAMLPMVSRSTLFWSFDQTSTETMRRTGSVDPVAK